MIPSIGQKDTTYIQKYARDPCCFLHWLSFPSAHSERYSARFNSSLSRDSYLCLRRVCDCPRQYLFRQVKARHTNPFVRHPVVNVEAIWSSKIVTPVDARREHDIGDRPIAFLRKHRRQHRLNSSLTIVARHADAALRAPSLRPSSTEDDHRRHPPPHSRRGKQSAIRALSGWAESRRRF